MPSFLAKTNYRNVEDLKGCPLQQGLGTTESLFEWYAHQPENLEYFMKWLPKHRGSKSWLDSGLVEEIVSKQDEDDTVIFIDVGGNVGNICVDLRKRIPELKGRVFNQDLEHVVANTVDHPGVERSAHNFWTEQPIKGMQSGSETEGMY